MNGRDGLGGLASAVIINIKMCDCSGNGTCNFDTLRSGVSSTASFQLVTCTCNTGYDG